MKSQSNRGTSVKNGHRRSSSRPSNDDSGNQRLVFLIASAMGKKCIATITDGSRYQGLLVGSDVSPAQGSASAPLSVVLLKPRLISKSLINEKNNLDKLPENLIIQAKDLIDLEVVLDLNEETRPRLGFKKDSDISGQIAIKERELQRWVPDDDVELTLEDDGGEWDQFKVNEEKFGVESTYDEHLYTTRIDTSAPDYHERVARAEKIAKEIEQQATTDRHILEERGIQVDDSGMDEEDKYSGVDRRGDELMAALRNASISNDSSSSSSAKPTQRNAHYHNDPAIISSSKQRKPDSIPPKPPVPNESFRLNAQSEINSLREFSANFKIPHKMPQDLLPILAKDKLKQDEILKKQQTGQGEPKKKESKTFKLNPKAAAFTPSSKHATITSPPNFHKSPINPSPKVSHTRPYSSNGSVSSQGSAKKHHHISAADFFGGSDKVPTKETQQKKIVAFRCGFSMFVTTRNKHKDATPVVYEKTFQTPPTWDSTVDEAHNKLFARHVAATPFAPSPMMTAPIPYGNKFPMSPQQQQQQAAAAAAMVVQIQQQQQQQQQQPQHPHQPHPQQPHHPQPPQHQQQFAMMYQQQFPPQVPMFYGDPTFFPPAGFIPLLRSLVIRT
ncbi:PAB1-binding protein 1 [Candida viswanathii]|uniref:PAB1-binding protein 1 n=1 Tax=Candida viswanathii TaxID=5486 RepID=A0A367XNP8_9ASCO|nr:PAB1-binding protein 1 [Candida viswanathii]